MTSINSLNTDPQSVPSQINFGPAPTIPSSFSFGPSPNISPANFSFGPAPRVDPGSYTFGPAPMVSPASFEFGPAPDVSVSWGSAPSIVVNLNSVANKTVTSNTAGVAGEICWDVGYLYVCTSQNSWKRIALSAF